MYLRQELVLQNTKHRQFRPISPPPLRKLTSQEPEVRSRCPCSTHPHMRDYMLDSAFALFTRLIYLFLLKGFNLIREQ